MPELTCQDCGKRDLCTEPCVFIEALVGKGKGTRELLPSSGDRHLSCTGCQGKDSCSDQCEEVNYNARLASIQERKAAFRRHTTKDIQKIKDTRLRAIAALRCAGGFKIVEFPDIVKALNVKKSTLYRIINQGSDQK